MVRSRFTIISFFVLSCLVRRSFATELPSLTGPYFGQLPPGTTASVFAPEIVSVTGRYEYALSFSPDGLQLLFSTETSDGATLLYSHVEDGSWTLPVTVDLSDGVHSNEMEAFFSPDGERIFFAPYSEGFDVRIWQIDVNGDQWSNPRQLPGSVAEAPAFFPTSTINGILYYTNIKEKKAYRAEQDTGGVWQTRPAGLEFGGHSFVSPDGSFVLVDARATDSLGKGDIYVAFALADGGWTKPMNLGAAVNSEYSESCPSLSADGRYLFFSRYDEKDEISQIYWIDAGVIGNLQTQALGDETLIVKRTVVDSIAWALTKDRALLESIIAHDEDYFSFHPEGLDPVHGYAEFEQGFGFWMSPDFVATRTEVRNFRCHFSASKEVAWFSAILDDCFIWKGNPGCWQDTRWTGVLEKQNGRWVIMQMHFSFAATG